MSEGMSGGTYPNRNWPLSLNEKVARASKMAEGGNAPYAMERKLARDVLELAAQLRELQDDLQYARDAVHLHVDTEGGGWIVSEPIQDALDTLNRANERISALAGSARAAQEDDV
jgi:outer membrane murein-binding lipoprotein Lpp